MSNTFTIRDTAAFIEFVEGKLAEEVSFADAFGEYQQMSAPPDGIVVILHYTPKSHAIIGNTKDIKDKLMALNGEKKLVSFNRNLSVGPGWVVLDIKRLSEITDMFDENSIEYNSVEMSKYTPGAVVKAVAKSTKPAGKTAAKSDTKSATKSATKSKAPAKKVQKEESDDEDSTDATKLTIPQLKAALKEAGLPTTGKKEELIERLQKSQKSEGDADEATVEDEELDANPEPPKKVAKAAPKTAAKTSSKTTSKTNAASKGKTKGKTAPAAKSVEGVKLVATENDFGNFQEAETGIVFAALPVGPSGRKDKVAIGIQNTESEETGISSLNPLTDDLIEICEKKKWRYLTDDMMKILSKKDPDTYESLNAMRGGADVEEDDE